MNKIKPILVKIFRITKYPIIIFSTLIILNCLGRIIERFDTQEGLHTYTIFGDGRFEVWSDTDKYYKSSLSFVDTKPIGSDTIVAEVERYYKADDYLYVLGYHSDTGVDAENPRFPSFANLIDQKKRIKYYSLSDIPRYSALNYKTAEMKLYKTLEEVPQDQRIYFTKKLNFWCNWMSTCYQTKDVK